MKSRSLVFSVFDWCFICGVIVIIGSLFFIPFFDPNNRAILYMALKQYEKAEKKWVQVLSKDSFSSFYRMNLALNYILFNQPDKAIREYELTRNLLKLEATDGKFKIQKQSTLKNDLHTNESAKIKSEMVREDAIQDYKNKILFYSFFNSAVVSSQKGEVESALGFYQQALELYPNSLEVKTNIELLSMKNPTSGDKEKNKKEQDKKKDKGDKKGSSENEQKDQNKGESSKKDEEQNKESDGKNDKKEQQDNQEKEDSNQEEKQEEQQNAQGNNKGDATDKGDQDSSENQQGKQRNDEKQDVNARQKEAILKAILEQEKRIRKRRNQKENRKSPPIEKDW